MEPRRPAAWLLLAGGSPAAVRARSRRSASPARIRCWASGTTGRTGSTQVVVHREQ